MAVGMRSILGLAMTVWLAAPGAAAAADAELPWQHLAANLKVHKVVADIDQGSFETATAYYPMSEAGGRHPIGTGRYFFWKTVGLFSRDQSVGQIRLASFTMPCRPSKIESAIDVICDLTAAVLVRSGGRTRVVDISIHRDVGRFFDPAEPDHGAEIYAEIREPIDLAVARIRAELESAGAL
jgi:hypothetical protein